jgi:pimeloyl-ACP methyl ester carboxylesterase/DNA-binding CsgD family transcriptional regulator
MAGTRQRIRYLLTTDGVRLAWAEAGSGPVLVKAANWLTHLEYEWESPVWRHWIRFFSDHFRFVRYDERGCGMTDWKVEDLSEARRLEDFEAVMAAAVPSGPAALLGISQGTASCVRYAVKHPERVSRMVLYGGYARGVWRRGDAEKEREYRAVIDLIRLRWGSDNPAFRQVFTSRFVPSASDEQLRWFNDVCTKTTSAAMAGMLLETRGWIDVDDLLPQVRVPTLVIHSREDQVTPLSEGKRLAAGIPGAQFIEVDSKNHVLLEHEPAWPRFCDAVLDFMGIAPDAPPQEAFTSLSPREREILALLSDGLSNGEIAERLRISDKTVRNHVSNVFDKLGVWTRAQAIVFARERGFAG